MNNSGGREVDVNGESFAVWGKLRKQHNNFALHEKQTQPPAWLRLLLLEVLYRDGILKKRDYKEGITIYSVL